MAHQNRNCSTQQCFVQTKTIPQKENGDCIIVESKQKLMQLHHHFRPQMSIHMHTLGKQHDVIIYDKNAYVCAKFAKNADIHHIFAHYRKRSMTKQELRIMKKQLKNGPDGRPRSADEIIPFGKCAQYRNFPILAQKIDVCMDEMKYWPYA